jgi:hypothetical protein
MVQVHSGGIEFADDALFHFVGVHEQAEHLLGHSAENKKSKRKKRKRDDVKVQQYDRAND